MKFNISDLHSDAHHDIAWVVCIERISSAQLQRDMESTTLATNIYGKCGEEWRLIRQHGSPVYGNTLAPNSSNRSHLN